MRRVGFLSSILLLFLLLHCAGPVDGVIGSGVYLSGGVLNLNFTDFTFRIQEDPSGTRRLSVYGIAGNDSLIVQVLANGVKNGAAYPIYAFRNIQFGGRFHSLPEIGVTGVGGSGTLTFTAVDTSVQVSGQFSPDARLTGSDFSDPDNPASFPVTVSGGFVATLGVEFAPKILHAFLKSLY